MIKLIISASLLLSGLAWSTSHYVGDPGWNEVIYSFSSDGTCWTHGTTDAGVATRSSETVTNCGGTDPGE